jgi:hypothetical protein
MRNIQRVLTVAISSLWPVLVLFIYARRWVEVHDELLAWMKGQYAAGLEIVNQMETGGYTIALPAFSEAVIRAGQAAAGAFIVLAAAQAVGWLLFGLMLWSPAHRLDRILYRTAVGLGGIAYISLVLAVLNQYSIHRTSALIGFMAAGGLAYIFTLCGAGKENQEVPPEIDPVPAQPVYARRKGDRLWQGVAVTAVIAALVGALAPETGREAILHHLWLPQQWLANGQLVYHRLEPAALYPQTWELIFGAALSIGGFGAAKLLNFSAFLFNLILVYRMAARFLPAANPWLAVAIFATIPSILWLSTTASIMSGVVMYVGLTVYALLHYLEGRQRGWLALAIVNLGLAMASSHLAVVVLFISIAVLAAVLWGVDRSRRSFLTAAALASAAITFPLPWYLRSWLASGQEGFTLTWDGVGLFGNITLQPAAVPVFLLLGLMMLFLPRSSLSSVLIQSFVALYAIWMALLYPLQGIQALLPAAPLAAVLAAAAYQRWQELLPGGAVMRKVISWITALVLLSNIASPSHFASDESDGVPAAINQIPLGVVIGYETEEDYLTRKVPSYAVWQYANTNLPPDSRVLNLSGEDNLHSRVHRVRSDDMVDIFSAWEESAREEKMALDRLRGMGVTHILIDKLPQDPSQAKLSILLQEAFIDRYYQLLYEDDFYILYELQKIRLFGVEG